MIFCNHRGQERVNSCVRKMVPSLLCFIPQTTVKYILDELEGTDQLKNLHGAASISDGVYDKLYRIQ